MRSLSRLHYFVRKIYFFTAAGLMLFTLCICRNPMGNTIWEVVDSFSKPKYIVSPENGEGISQTTSITIQFSESMDTDYCIISGTMAEERGDVIWSSKDAPHDTLTISPGSSNWSVGSNKTLVIDCKDLDDNVAAISLTYGVLDGNVYVRQKDGDDRFPGTKTKPKATIQAAVDLAERYYEEANVNVAQGDYEIDTPVSLSKSISLFGGFSEDDWDDREKDPEWAVSGDNESEYSTNIILPAPDSDHDREINTVLTIENQQDGLTISGFCMESYVDNRSCVISIKNSSFIDIISNKILVGNNIVGDKTEESYGINIYNSVGVVIEKNYVTILAGSSFKKLMYWFSITGSEHFSIKNNIIKPGIMDNDKLLFVIKSTGDVMNNEIIPELDGGTMNINIQDDSICDIINNIVEMQCTNTSDLIINNFSSELNILNNTFIGEGMYLVFDIGNTTTASTSTKIGNNIIIIDGIETIHFKIESMSIRNNNIYGNDESYVEYLEGEYPDLISGNISEDPFFPDKDGDYHLTEDSPVNTRQGGLDLSDQFTEDKDGNPRTAERTGNPTNDGAAGWSIGAYEFD